MRVYLLGWPSGFGGADTKFAHLIGLLHRRYSITVVTPYASQLKEKVWTRRMDTQGIPYCTVADLPAKLRGWGVALCHGDFLRSPDWAEMRRRGLKMAWGNEMMWPLAGEAGAVTLGQVDVILYTSAAQRAILEPQYQRYLKGTLHTEPVRPSGRRVCGWIEGRTARDRLRWVMVGNYIDPFQFPFRDRFEELAPCLTVGRLSRADPTKFLPDFPASYEGLGLKNPRFRVMAWTPQLRNQWPTRRFDERWDLLPASAETAAFLQSLDLFVYEVGPRCRESWGRAVVEAMLTGAIPLVPKGGGHHLENLVEHRRTGFLCRYRADFGRYARYLQDHPDVRRRMSRECRQAALRRFCDVRRHLQVWDKVFHGD